MSRFDDYISSNITAQMTLLEKLNAIIKYLKTESQFNVFCSSQKWMDNISEYNVSDVNTGNYELEINDIVVFKNGYYSYVKTIGNGLFTIGELYYFVGEKGETGTGVSSIEFNSSRHLILTYTNGDVVDLGLIKGVSSFSIDGNQHLIVNYDNNTTQDLGSIFTGNININGNFTANSIIENMSGYSFAKASDTSYNTFSYVYSGAVKNGNKLTLVIAFNVTKLISTSAGICGDFTVPSSVFLKLYPVSISGNSYLVRGKVQASDQSDLSYYDVPFSCYRGNNSTIRFTFNNGNIPVNGTAYVRIEVTFLLSENLAGE